MDQCGLIDLYFVVRELLGELIDPKEPCSAANSIPTEDFNACSVPSFGCKLLSCRKYVTLTLQFHVTTAQLVTKITILTDLPPIDGVTSLKTIESTTDIAEQNGMTLGIYCLEALFYLTITEVSECQ